MEDQDRKVDYERGTFVRTTAHRSNPSAVQLDDLFHERKTQSQTALPTGCAGVSLAESFEQMRQKVRVNSFAGVSDGYFKVRLDALEEDLNPPFLGCEFDRVAQ